MYLCLSGVPKFMTKIDVAGETAYYVNQWLKTAMHGIKSKKDMM